jgi:subfamily B ATP-binding cassette protein MsbA
MAEDPSLPEARNLGDWATYKRLLGYARPYWRRLLAGVFFGALFGGSTFFALLSVWLGLEQSSLGGEETTSLSDGKFLEDFVRSTIAYVGDPDSPLYFTIAIFVLVFIFVTLRGIGFFLSKYLVEWVGQRIVMDMRNEIFGHIQNLSMAQIGSKRTGELMSRTANDTQMVERGVSTVLGDIANQPFVLLAGIAVLLRIDYRLATLSLLLFPICIIPVIIFGRKVRKFARRGQASLGSLASVQQEAIAGSRIVKAFGTEQQEQKNFERTAEGVFKNQVRVLRSRVAITPIIELISIVTGFALIAYTRMFEMSLDDLLIFLAVLIIIYDPIKRLSRLHIGVQQASAAADRIFEILNVEVGVEDRSGAEPLVGELEEVTFQDLHFRYDDEWVLQGVDLKVKAGEVVAIVGGSGAGKTTLVSLLPRFFDTTKGSVRINGRDIRDYTISSLRAHIGLVTQETFLFNRTIAENIAYGQESASRQEIETAARRAHAHEFILEEGGYDVVIGERGDRLSGGQRQRLAIARALLRNPPILILDEAMSSLDTESERFVQAALDELMEGRTVFAIAHRLSTIRNADRILVLRDGNIVEEGTHDALIEQAGAYKYYYDLQFAPADG